MTKTKKFPSVALYIFIPAAILCVILRYILVLFGIDFETGFIYDDMNWLCGTNYVLYAVFGVAFVLLGILENKRGSRFFTKKMSRLTELQTLVIGAALILSGAGTFMRMVGMFADGLGIDFLFAVVGLAGYLIVGFILLGNRRIMPLAGHLMIILAVYYTLCAARLFMQELIITRITDYLIDLLVYLMLVMFFLTMGRIFGRNEGKTTRIKALAFGLTAALLIAARGIAALVLNIIAPANIKDAMAASEIPFTPDFELYAAGIAVLAIVVSLYSRRVRKVKKVIKG